MEKTRGATEVNKIILDANVLIDFYTEDPSLIQLVTEHIGNVLLPKTILKQVRQLTLPDCEKLGLTVFRPSIEVLLQARERIPGLNFPDRICLFEAKARQIPLFANDKKLLNFAVREKIKANWGLDLLVTLFKAGHIGKDGALGYARNLCERTPYPTDRIMGEFHKKMIE